MSEVYWLCNECDVELSQSEVDNGTCLECGARWSAVPITVDPQPARFTDAD